MALLLALTTMPRPGLGQEMPADRPGLEPAPLPAPLPGGDVGPSGQRPGSVPAPPPAPRGSPLRSILPKVKLPPEEAPPPPGNPWKIPLSNSVSPDRLEIKETDGLVSLTVRDVPLNRVLMALGQRQKLNIVCSDNATMPVSVALDKVPLEVALTSIVSVAGCSWTQQNGIVYVTNVSTTSKLPAELQGRQVRVFRLDFASATDMDTAVKGLLSPVGRSFITVSKATDNRKTQELVVVEDLPAYVRVIEQYVRQVDRPPRQVLIEAYVLAVTLQRDQNFGLNFQVLIEQLGKAGGFQVTGFANPKAAQAFFFSVDRGDLKVLLEALATQTNAKTLASPKVLVINGQEAKIQIGQQLGFRVTTTTETSTLQNVNFLDVGVILKVTPRITSDNQVLMLVHPEVSKGQVNPLTGLPESDTTTVESSVMLPDGQGMVIGGLIQEKDTEMQQKIPVLGDLWLIGRLFQRQEIKKERQEIVIALVPRIVPSPLACDDRHATEVLRSQTPLFEGPLDRAERPWEAKLPDAIENPFHLQDLPAMRQRMRQICGPEGAEPTYAAPYYAGERQPCPPPSRIYGSEYPDQGYAPAQYVDPAAGRWPAERAPLPHPDPGPR